MLILRTLVVLAVVAVCVGAIAPSERRVPTRYELDNGLEVILAPDDRVPKVALSLVYKVGSINEPPGRSGFAHLFEHLMFSGTPAWPDFDVAYSALGLDNNATTAEDQTTYWGTGLASALPVMLSIEADRMANLGNAVDQSELDVQRNVVLNEMRQSVLDQPGAGAMTALETGLYPKSHPYARAVIGSISDLEAAQLDDVRAFFNRYYVPNNAILVLVGDFEIDAVKAMVEETFGLVPRGADVTTLPYEPVAPAHLSLDLEDRVPFTLVLSAFVGPPSSDKKENAALWIASELLSNYEYGRFRTGLVNTGLATYAFGGWSPRQLGGVFIVGGAPADGVAVEDMRAAMLEVITEFATTKLDPVDVERARANFIHGDRVAMEGYLARALSMSALAAYGTDVTGPVEDIRGFAEVTVEDVEAAAQRLLAFADASTVILRPGARASYPPVLTESSGEASPLASVERLPVAVPQLPAGEPALVEMPDAQTATLSNGIEVVHYQIAGAPRMYVAASVSGGGNNDPPGKEALYSMAVAMASRGAGTLDLDAFSKASKDLNADVSGLSGTESSALLLGVPPENFDAALPLFADALLRPRFDEGPWSVLVRETISGLKGRQTDLPSAAGEALDNLLFVPGPGDSAIHSSLESVSAIGPEDAKAAYARLFVPATTTFYSIGGLPLADVVSGLEREFGGWTSEGEGLQAKAFPPVVFPASQRVFVLPEAGASQAIILVARPAPGFDDPTQPEAVVVARLLGGEFLSRLNTLLREEKGYSYGIDAAIWQTVRTDTALIVSAPVDANVVGPALSEVLKGFAGLATIPVSDSELNRSVTAYLTSLASAAETSEGLAGAVLGAIGAGLTVDEMEESQLAVTRLSLDEVRAQAKLMAGLDHAVIIVAGDAELIVPQLAAIGITDVEMLPRGD